jgi:hypothetical protein
MNTYIWKIESLEYVVSFDGQSNIVSNIHWRLIGHSEQKKEILNIDDSVSVVPFSGQVYGSELINYASGNSFVEYAELTEQIVVGWLEASLGSEKIAELKLNIDSQITAQVNPTTGSGLPWSNN